MKSPKLEKQLRKIFGAEEIDSNSEGFPDRLKRFLDQVDSSYCHSDDRLELANRNLEVGSSELKALSDSVKAMMDSLGQGYLIFDKFGFCSGIFSKACEELLETIPAGKQLWEVLKIDISDQEEIDTWIRMMFEETIDFRDLAILGPAKFKHSQNRSIHLEYKPIRDLNNRISGIVLIATDRTAEDEKQFMLDEKKRYVDKIVQLSNNRHQFKRFVNYTNNFLAEVQLKDDQTRTADEYLEIRRKFHTIKGGAGMFGMDEFKTAIHLFESEMKVLIEESPISTNKVDQLIIYSSMKLMELLSTFVVEFQFIVGDNFHANSVALEIEVERIRDYILTLQDSSEAFIRMVVAQSVQSYFSGYNHFCASIADQLGKAINPLEINCGDFRVPPGLYDDLFSTFVHLFANSITHGIESSQDRIKLNKTAAGNIALTLTEIDKNAKKWWVFTVKDDGRGINIDQLRKTLVEKGHLEALNEDTPKLLQRILNSNISTSQKTNQFTGRGVGVGAVRFEVEKLGGSIVVSSETGKYSSFKIEVPQIWEMK
jgi:two-component system chemotaxis sensor kinase CheA